MIKLGKSVESCFLLVGRAQRLYGAHTPSSLFFVGLLFSFFCFFFYSFFFFTGGLPSQEQEQE